MIAAFGTLASAHRGEATADVTSAHKLDAKQVAALIELIKAPTKGEEATLLVPNDLVKQMAEASFGVKVSGDTVVLPGVMSRKKQIIPALKL